MSPLLSNPLVSENRNLLKFSKLVEGSRGNPAYKEVHAGVI